MRICKAALLLQPILGSLSLAVAFSSLQAWPFAFLGISLIYSFMIVNVLSVATLLLVFLAGLVFNSVSLLYLMGPEDSWEWVKLILLSQVLSAYWLILFVMMRGLMRVPKCRSIWPLMFSFAWISVEFVRLQLGLVFGERVGFPFLQLGHSVSSIDVLFQSAGIWGTLGVSFIVCWISSLVIEFIGLPFCSSRENSLAPISIALSICIAFLFLHLQVVSHGGDDNRKIAIGIVSRFDLNRNAIQIAEDVNDLCRRSREGLEDVDLWIWPEKAILHPLEQVRACSLMKAAESKRIANSDPYHEGDRKLALERSDFSMIGSIFRGANILGIDRVAHDGPRAKRYVSSILLDEDGRVSAWHDKRFLVPFAEFVPINGLSWLQEKSIESGASHGTDNNCPTFSCRRGGGVRAGVLICYDVSFSSVIVRDVRGQLPDLLVNIGNESSLSGRVANSYLLLMARFRAVELRRPMIRNVVDGYCGVINSLGVPVDIFDSRIFRHPALFKSRVSLDGRTSLYSCLGDIGVISILFSAIVIGYGSIHLVGLQRSRRDNENCNKE